MQMMMETTSSSNMNQTIGRHRFPCQDCRLHVRVILDRKVPRHQQSRQHSSKIFYSSMSLEMWMSVKTTIVQEQAKTVSLHSRRSCQLAAPSRGHSRFRKTTMKSYLSSHSPKGLKRSTTRKLHGQAKYCQLVLRMTLRCRIGPGATTQEARVPICQRKKPKTCQVLRPKAICMAGPLSKKERGRSTARTG
ncbi:hypothetical protein EJ04DRAFT_2523 [Polyplosphaeria fusca]|uniref:Uncharacterized protein n=1 Tax=Polyplosphaeria fusca TaxID=682080 RepID=A0A9P4RDT8_9PLEO|nr:hypothetical protein EJ04DRAFT_2523 [Polyplosphaeria fusca]